MTKNEFFAEMNNWCNYKHLLWPALQAVKESPLPVVELGAGHGSTPLLKRFCTENGMEFFSYDNTREWADKLGSEYVEDWDQSGLWAKQYSLCFIDMAPGEYRKKAMVKINADIVVIHDSEPAGWNESDYRVRPTFKRFRYMRDYKTKGAWTTALSNTINVTQWDVSSELS